MPEGYIPGFIPTFKKEPPKPKPPPSPYEITITKRKHRRVEPKPPIVFPKSPGINAPQEEFDEFMKDLSKVLNVPSAEKKL